MNATAASSRSQEVRRFAVISKVNDEERIVEGYASTTDLDNQGERITKQAMANALPDYMKFANVREMHQPSAVGVCKSATVDDTGMYISAHVVDDDAWKKVKAGVYKGFSIGGRSTQKIDKVISGMRLTEISLVDRPANPECVIELWKGDGMSPTINKETQRAAVLELADMLDKGNVDAVSLLALAKGDALVVENPTSAPAAEVLPVTTTATVVNAEGTKDAAANAEPAVLAVSAVDPVASGADVAVGAVDAVSSEPAPVAKAEVIDPAPVAVVAVAAAAATAATVVPVAPVAPVIKKGMNTAAQLGLLIKQLAYLTQNQNDETAREKDNSPVAAMMHDLVVQAGKVLVAMVTEETAELASNVDPDADPEDKEYVSSAPTVSSMSYADQGGDIAKGGAKFSADTQAALSDIHKCFKSGSELMDKLGYAAAAPNPDAAEAGGMRAAKAADAGDIAKSELNAAVADRDAALAKVAGLETAAADLTKRLDEMEKRLAKVPTAPRGRLMVVQKSDDVGGTDDAPATATTGPIMKSDGTVDQVATAENEMRKVFASRQVVAIRR